MMRIVGGLYRHRLIEYPNDSLNIRPTKDRIREAIFSALNDINNFVTLDLYAGSGAMGIEAISRGAKENYFVDINPIAIKTIEKNVKNLQIPQQFYKILNISDVEALDLFNKNNSKFDVVFLDPPYAKGEYGKIIDLLFENNILSEHGIIVTESNYLLDIKEEKFSKTKNYKYGDIYVSILRR